MQMTPKPPLDAKGGFDPSGGQIATNAMDPDLLVAAGLLQGINALSSNLSAEAATESLRALLCPGALWVAEPYSPEQAASARDRLGRVPQWRFPPLPLNAGLTAIIRSAWAAALPPPRRGWGQAALRVQVDGTADAQRLCAVGTVGGYLLAPIIACRPPLHFSWSWPIRIGIAEGPGSQPLFNQLLKSPYAELFDICSPAPEREAPVDILLVDADHATSRPPATCVILIGTTTSPAELIARGCDASRAAIVVAVTAPEAHWFDAVIRQMAHDQPLDVALRIAAPSALIAADADLLALTAVRQWALGLAARLQRVPHAGINLTPRGGRPADQLQELVHQACFDAEHNGAARIVKLARTLYHQGHDTSVQIHMARMAAAKPAPHAETVEMTMAEAPPEPQVDAAATAQPGRHLIADAWDGTNFLRSTLPPDADLELLVKIAVPLPEETSARQVFPEGELPPGESVELMVHAVSDDLGLRSSRPIVMSTEDRGSPSTTAVFPFHTKGENSVVNIRILVTYRERPLQEACYVATVRSRAVPGDRASINLVALTCSPEPRANATPAQISLAVHGANLESTGKDYAVDLTQLRPLLDQIEGLASRVLGVDDAPEQLDDKAATELLVDLARLGTVFKGHLRPLKIGKAQTISLLVDASTPVLPLELVYDAAAPQKGAVLCEHRPGGTKGGHAGICPEAGKKVVCPQAFWGQQRVIARTIRLDDEPRNRAEIEPLALRPVLYAATTRADKGAPPGGKPSNYLATELKSLVGGKNFKRVKNWDEWQEKIQSHPQLLVVLGHTEISGGEMMLEIGERSFLRRPDVNEEFIRIDQAPPPLLILLACSTAVPRDCFGGLTAAFAGSGAAAVVATLTKMQGPQGARAAAAIIRAMRANSTRDGNKLGIAMQAARRQLIEEGLLVGLLLVAHGEIDLPLQL